MSEIKIDVTPKTTKANWQVIMELLKENSKFKYESAKKLINSFEETMKSYDEAPSELLTSLGMEVIDDIKNNMIGIDEEYDKRIEDACRVLFMGED